MARQKIQLPVSLSGHKNRRETCRECLISRLNGRPGIYGVEVYFGANHTLVNQAVQTDSFGGSPLQTQAVGEDDKGHAGVIELDYDPEVVSLSQINAYLRAAGGCLSQTVAHLVLEVEGIASQWQEAGITDRLSRLPNVVASVSFASQTIRVEFDRRACALPEIVNVLEEMGITLRKPVEQVRMKASGGGDLSLRSSDGSCCGKKNDLAAGKTSEESGAGAKKKVEPDRRRSGCCSDVEQLQDMEMGDVAVIGTGDWRQWVKAALSQQEMVMAILSGIFLVAGATIYWTQGPESLRIALLLVSYVCGGFFPAQAMVQTIAQWRLDIDLLMFGAAFGAAALGHLEEGAMLLFLFSLGGAGEELALSRARNAIGALAKLSPRTAQLIEASGRLREVPVEDLRIGDRVFVSPGQQIPADGLVTDGASAVNQAAITGESIPVDKTRGDSVFAGTLNGDGALTVEVKKYASDNTLAKVIRMVQEAQSTKSPTQLFTDKVEQWYVPVVILATVGVAVFPPVMAGLVSSWQEFLRPQWFPQSYWKGWFYQSMAFLTAASPCALAIGTPAAVLSGIGRAAQVGVLMKGGAHLENLGRIRAIAFDKTGTLTRGQPVVMEIVPLAEGISPRELLATACAIEQASQHPLAVAIVEAARQRGWCGMMAEQIEQKPGLGIRGLVNGRMVVLGRAKVVVEQSGSSLSGVEALTQKAQELESRGQTVVAVAEKGRVLGVLGLADEIRPEMPGMIASLKSLGVEHIIMLTGDNATTAAAVAEKVGLQEYEAELLPEDKLTRIKELNAKYRYVAMVGDGVNDAPALAQATVGIAIGGAGGSSASDVAMETADVALLGSDMRQLPAAVGVSRFSRKIIVQNLMIALGVIAVVSPLAALGWTNIALAVLLHEGSTVLVVLNALRILRYR